MNNRFVPDSSKGIAVREGFAPGDHPESVWVDMPEEGVSWEVYGRSVEANTESPRCDFERTRVEVARRPEGRGLPDPAGLPAISMKESLAFTRNVLGAGSFLQRRAGSFTLPGFVLFLPGGPGGELLPVAGVPPELLEPSSGPRTDGSRLYELEIFAEAEHEGAWENAQIDLSARIGESIYPRQRYAEENGSGAQTRQTFRGTLPATGGEMEFDFWEPDKGSSDEHYEVDIAVGEGGYVASVVGGSSLTAVFGENLTIYQTKQGKTNRATFTVRQIGLPGDPNRPVRLCALWPTGYVDNGSETEAGIPLAGTGLRGYPASFARYELSVVSAFEETHPSAEPRYLDREGCIPAVDGIRASQLMYLDGMMSGGRTGGLELFLKVSGELRVPAADGGAATFIVYDYAKTTFDPDNNYNAEDPLPFEMSMQLTHYSTLLNGIDASISPIWGVEGGVRVPPDQVTLTGDAHNDGPNVAATLGRALARLNHEGTLLPANE